MFLAFEMPVERLPQSALAEGRSRLNLFLRMGQRNCLSQREFSIVCESWGQLAYGWSGGDKLLSKFLPSFRRPLVIDLQNVVLHLQTWVQLPAQTQHKQQLCL